MISLPKQLVVIGDSSFMDGEIMKVEDAARGLENIASKNKMGLVIFKIRNYTYRLSSKVLVK